MNNLRWTSILLSLTLFVGCSSDEGISGESEVTSHKSFSVVTPTTTRSTTAFDTNNSFYLYIDQTGDSYDYFVKMVYESNEWVAKSLDSGSTVEMEMVDAVADIKISALYGDTLSTTLADYTSDETSYAVDEDLLYANNEEGTLTIDSSGVIEITFAHLFSRLNVTITTSETLTSATLQGVDSSFTWAASEGSEAITLSGDSTTAVALTSGVTTYIAPQEVSSLLFNITLSSGSYSAVIDQSVTFAAGESRSLTIEAGSQTPIVTLDGVNASEWKDDGNDDFEFEI